VFAGLELFCVFFPGAFFAYAILGLVSYSPWPCSHWEECSLKCPVRPLFP